MSEEMKKPEREIGEAELTGVSGGQSYSPGISLRRGSATLGLARAFCGACPASEAPHRCAGGAEQLLTYVNHSPRTIIGVAQCPFFKG